MIEYVINAILIFAFYFLLTRIKCCNNSRGEMDNGGLTVEIGRTIYKVCCKYKANGGTVSDKLIRIMEKELEISENICYNERSTNTQKSLDCKPEKEAI